MVNITVTRRKMSYEDFTKEIKEKVKRDILREINRAVIKTIRRENKPKQSYTLFFGLREND